MPVMIINNFTEFKNKNKMRRSMREIHNIY